MFPIACLLHFALRDWPSQEKSETRCHCGLGVAAAVDVLKPVSIPMLGAIRGGPVETGVNIVIERLFKSVAIGVP